MSEEDIKQTDIKQTENIHLFQDKAGQLFLTKEHEKEPIRVQVKPCFPWSKEGQYYSLLNEKHEEVHLIRSLGDLGLSSRQALEASLNESSFCFQVTELLSLEEDFELRIWKVKTQQGERTFQTKLMDWPREIQKNEFVVKDIHGDIFIFSRINEFSEPGRSLLWSFLED